MVDIFKQNKILLGVVIVIALVGAFRLFIYSPYRMPDTVSPGTVAVSDGTALTLNIPEAALPEGVNKSAIRGTALSVFELTERTQRLAEEDIVLSLIRLEPDGIEFSEPVRFTLSFKSEREVRPRVFNINNKGLEEITDFETTFDSQKKVMVVTGYVTHFSELAATKDKSQESYGEFVRRSREHIDYLQGKADSVTYYSDKAKYYRQMADAASKYADAQLELDRPDGEGVKYVRQRLDLVAKYEKEGLDFDEYIDLVDEQFPPTPDFDAIAPKALEQYARNILNDYDFRIKQEKDPFKRFDLVKERLELTADIYKEMQNPGFDERVTLPLGRDELGESSLIVDQSESIIKQIEDLIDAEQDRQKRDELIKRLKEIVDWFDRKSTGAGHDERVVPSTGEWERLRERLSKKYSPPVPPKPSCNIPAFQACANTFNLQGCINACPYVSAPCPPGTPPGTDCKKTDKGCSDACWSTADRHIDSCLASSSCTKEEVIAGGGGARR